MSTGTTGCETFGCSLAQVCRIAAGVACLFGGLALILTLWLMVIGVPLALFGVALIASDPT